MATFGDVVAHPTGNQSIENWHAMAMGEQYNAEVTRGSGVPEEWTFKDEKGKPRLTLYKGEGGFLVDRRENQILAQFTRYDHSFLIAVPKNIVTIGARYVPHAKKIENYKKLTPKQSLPATTSEMEKWRASGTPLEQYIRSLWMAFRNNEDAFVTLGMPRSRCKMMFGDDLFCRNIDRIIERTVVPIHLPADPPEFLNKVADWVVVLHPKLKEIMNRPRFSIHDLVDHLPKHTETFPANGVDIIYLRVYTHLDDQHRNASDFALYAGQTAIAQSRYGQHIEEINKRAKAPRDTRLKTHYDWAARSREAHRHVLVASAPPRKIGAQFNDGGLPMVKDMFEQTVMLILNTHVPWIHDSNAPDNSRVQRVRFLTQCEKNARARCGFATGWVTPHGTNISSPLFDALPAMTTQFPKGYDPAVSWDEKIFARTIQALEPVRPHPLSPGKTVYRFARPLHKFHYPTGFRFQFTIHGLYNHDGQPKMANIDYQLPSDLSKKMAAVMTDGPKISTAIIAFELMHDGVEHPCPFYGLPSIGPYRNFDDARSLGARIEWADSKNGKWYTAYFSRGPRPAAATRVRAIVGDQEGALRIYREATAVLNMLRSKAYVNPPKSWWQQMAPATVTSPAVIEKLVVDHLEQRVRVITPEVEATSGPTPASYEYNLLLMERTLYPLLREQSNNYALFAPRQWPADQFFTKPKGGSTTGAIGRPRDICDTVRLSQKMTALKTEAWFTIDDADKSQTGDAQRPGCRPCKDVYHRPCTVTPDFELARGYLGDDKAPPVAEGRWYHVGRGPYRFLVFHDTMDANEKDNVIEIAEPYNARALLGFISLAPEDAPPALVVGADDDAGDD